MNKVKKMLSTVGASLVLAASMSGVAAADASATNNCTGGGVLTAQGCTAQATDNSDNRSYSGNCYVVNAKQSNDSTSKNVSEDQNADGGNGSLIGTGGAGGSNSNSQSNSINQDCSTNSSVTHVSQVSAGGRGAAQVSVPTGAVKAGAGGAVASDAAAVFGLGGSIASLGLGLALRRKSALEV